MEEGGVEVLKIDPSDGLLYSKADFLAEYGGTAEWDAAVEAKPKSDTSSQPASAAAAEVVDGSNEDVAGLVPQLESLPSYPLYVSQSESEEDEPEPAVNDPQQHALWQLVEIGFDPQAAQLALEAHASVEAAAAWLLQGADDVDGLAPAPLPAAALKPAAEDVLRIDPSDGLLYSQGDFIAEYGGTAEWNAASKAPPHTLHVPGVAPMVLTSTGGQGQSVSSLTPAVGGSMESYVSTRLAALSVDEDLCECLLRGMRLPRKLNRLQTRGKLNVSVHVDPKSGAN